MPAPSSSGTARSPPRPRRRWPKERAERLGADVAVAVTGVAPGGGSRGEARRPRLRARVRAGRGRGAPHRASRRPRDGARPRDGRRAAPRPPIVGEPAHIRVSGGATVGEMSGSGSSSRSELPSDVVGRAGALGSATSRGPAARAFHVTLAFLGSRPRSELDAILDVLREGGCRHPVGRARARALPGDALRRDARARRSERRGDEARRAPARAPRGSRRVRAGGPAVAPARHRPPVPRAPSARAAVAGRRGVRSVRRRCFPFRLHPSGARYEVLESCSLGRDTCAASGRERPLQGFAARRLRASELPALRTTRRMTA